MNYRPKSVLHKVHKTKEGSQMNRGSEGVEVSPYAINRTISMFQ